MKALAAILAALALAFTAIYLLQRDAAPAQGGGALVVYCAAGLKKPVEAIAEQYRRETGVEVQLQFGGTGSLLSAIRVARRGDLFLAADEGALADARKADAIRESIPLVRQHPVIAVRAGNPKSIRALADLQRADVRVALTNPEAASIGRVTKSALGAGYDALAAHATVMKPTVTDIASDLSLGAVDAAIVWDATVPQFAGLAAVEVPEFSARIENATAAVLAASTQSAAALRFARYLAAPEKGGVIFQKHGFQLAGSER